MKRKFRFLPVLLIFIAFSCSGSTPLERLKENLARYPEYTIILEDMKTSGTFFKDYHHRYKTVIGEKVSGKEELTYTNEIGDWQAVSQKEYKKYDKYLGMTLASKGKDGKVSNNQHPPGYQYAGNPQYGQWRNDSHGSSFWEFYGKYALMSQVFGMFSRPIYQDDWDGYRRARSRRQPYFGRQNEYGTNGSRTKKSNPTFFERRRAKEQSRRQSFKDKVGQRVRRSKMSSVRKRSRGYGK